MEKRVYTPIEYIEAEITRPVIFLAGPIQGAPDWQLEASKIIKAKRKNIIIASPRKEYLPGDFDYGEQVDWETFHLQRAGENGAIMFWLPRESHKINDRAYAQTSRIELGEWKVRHERDGAKLVVGIEPGFSGERYIRRRFGQDCPEVPILDNLEAACLTAIELVGKNTPPKKAPEKIPPPLLRINQALLDSANRAADAAKSLEDGIAVPITNVLQNPGTTHVRNLTREDYPLVQEIAELRIQLMALDIRASGSNIETTDIINPQAKK